ncbi:MAG: TldD/PmbA family protein [Deltaproteobacteria bacterium]|nr:TldD/PmbA family protein [Deltaproteobacteria bacterium]MBI4374773.1 TldD/PmbA family protein [Deltaproteobacteria bacterium]
MDPVDFLEKKISDLKIDGYEIYRRESRQLTIESKNRQVESSEKSVSHGLAVQLFSGAQIGFASTSEESTPFLERVVGLAYNTLNLVEEGVLIDLPKKQSVPPMKIDLDATLTERSFGEKADLAVRLEQKTMAYDRRIKRLRSVRYEEEEERVSIRNSRGFHEEYRRTLCELSLMAMAEEKGEQEMAWESDFSPYFKDLDPARTGERAAERAVALLGSQPIPSSKRPALLEPHVAASLLSVWASSFLGDQVMKGRSVLKDRLGEPFYSKEVDLIDDGRMPCGYATAPFDGEGVATRTTELVREGKILSYLHDQGSAVRLKMARTGNGVRSTYKERPRAGVTNLYLKPGTVSAGQLRQEMKKGFWIVELIGVHTVDTVTGDFSLGASGFWLEEGTRRPVRGVAVSGNLHELFRRVVGVGNDLKFYHAYGSPSLLVSEIDIGGV